MPAKVSLNTRQPDDLADRVRKDAARSGRSVDVIVEMALLNLFRSKSLSERVAIYSARPPKRAGAPLALEEKQ